MDERTLPETYESPALVEVGQFDEDTLGYNPGGWDGLLPARIW